jgi:hypothetical protein
MKGEAGIWVQSEAPHLTFVNSIEINVIVFKKISN